MNQVDIGNCMKTKYNLTEGSKWKELARQGKLSQKDFDTLKTSSVGKKYLNPRHIMKNKERGQNAELKKLLKKTGWTYSIVRDKNFNPRTRGGKHDKHAEIHLGPTPGNYRNIGYSDYGRPTALQRAGIKAHEKDELIQVLKSKKVTDDDYDKKEFKISAFHYNNKPFKFTKSQKKRSRTLEKRFKDVKTPDDLDLLPFDAQNFIGGYGHFPGVLNREFELRNLLYPSYRTSKRKKLQSFGDGKYTVSRGLGIPRFPDEIQYGKIPARKQTQMLKHNKRVLMNRATWNDHGIDPREVVKQLIQDGEL